MCGLRPSLAHGHAGVLAICSGRFVRPQFSRSVGLRYGVHQITLWCTAREITQPFLSAPWQGAGLAFGDEARRRLAGR